MLNEGKTIQHVLAQSKLTAMCTYSFPIIFQEEKKAEQERKKREKLLEAERKRFQREKKSGNSKTKCESYLTTVYDRGILTTMGISFTSLSFTFIISSLLRQWISSCSQSDVRREISGTTAASGKPDSAQFCYLETTNRWRSNDGSAGYKRAGFPTLRLRGNLCAFYYDHNG